jgi:hypothetical protein
MVRGRLARVLRSLLLVAWLLAAVGVYPLAHILGSVANNTAAANLPSPAPSTRVQAVQLSARITALAGSAASDSAPSGDVTAVQAIRAGHLEHRQQPGGHREGSPGQRSGIVAIILLIAYRGPLLWLLGVIAAISAPRASRRNPGGPESGGRTCVGSLSPEASSPPPLAR